MELVSFQPYPESDDRYRGTTVLPYLEAFYQYGNGAAEEAGVDRSRTTSLLDPSRDIPQWHVVQGNWVSEEDMFGQPEEAQSLHSVRSMDRSTENIIQRKSRVSSQENGQSRKG